MATAPENRRTDSIRVRLAPEMMERFENLASRYGMPPATLCPCGFPSWGSYAPAAGGGL